VFSLQDTYTQLSMVVATVALQISTPYVRQDEAAPLTSSEFSVGFVANKRNKKNNDNNKN
jgi:hypothetical protein